MKGVEGFSHLNSGSIPHPSSLIPHPFSQMRAYLPDYELKTPSDLARALEVLSNEPGVWRPFAGGTDLMVLFEAGRLSHRRFLNIWNLSELRGIEVTDE